MAMLALNLLWKELHELKWKVAATVAVALVMPLYSLLNDAGSAWYWVQAVLWVYPVFAGIFFGGWMAAGERTNHTAALLAALPVRPVWLGAVKLFAAVGAILIPILLLMLLGAIARPLSDRFLAGSHEHWLMGGVSCVIAVHILLLVAAVGTGRASEVAAAGWGAGAFAVWGTTAMLSPSTNVAWMQYVRWVGPPFEWSFAIINSRPMLLPGLLQFTLVAASMLVLGGLFIARYARAVGPIVECPQVSWSIGGWMPHTPRSPLGALIWKQLSETLPSSGLVLGIPLIFSTLMGIAGALENAPSAGLGTDWWLANALSWFMMLACWGGFVLALLLGVGTFLPDLERRTNTFWRSRPISAHQWFWTKYGVGLAALMLTIGVPLVIAFILSIGAGVNSAFFLEREGLWIVGGWIGVYNAAVTASCLVRRTAYAAILAVGLIAESLAVVYWWSGSFAKEPTVLVIEHAGFFILAAIACTLVGWWVAVRDAALLE